MSYNPYQSWEREHVDDVAELERVFLQDKPSVGGGDTEATGLHIIKDKAFLIVFGWLIPNQRHGRVYTFYPTPTNMANFFKLAKKLKYFVWWNVKYDLHMMHNVGFMYDGHNLVEGMAVARLVVEAIPARNGGDTLRLTDIGVKYVHHEANMSERLVKEGLTKANELRVRVLASALKQFDMEGHFTPTGKQKKWGKKAVEDFLKDPTKDLEDLPADIAEVWVNWQEDYPEATYEDIDRELMIKYAGEDVITMLEYFKKAYPVLLERKQEGILELENKLIYPLFRMERVGIATDQEYLIKSRERVKRYIIEKRNRMYEIAGEQVTVNQHERLRQLFLEKWGAKTPAMDNAVLKRVVKEGTPIMKEFAELIMELRTLEKWYSTYIKRIIRITSYDGRFYTQIAQCSAVSGRVGSDAQQFPRDAILTSEGQKLKSEGEEVPSEFELYHPRKVFKPTGNGYNRIYYIDQSQVELRVQAHYTLAVSGGDLNLCRAYMPFKCFREWEQGSFIEFDYTKQEDRETFMNYEWYFNEAPHVMWHPTDVHSETTHNALMFLDYECVDKYKEYHFKGTGTPFFPRHINEGVFGNIRNTGKTFNFMKNYGGGLTVAMKSLDLPRNVAQALIDGFSVAFPHVIKYQQSVQKAHSRKGYVKNMSGRRYYLKDNRASYKLANYLVQGTCADELKRIIIAIDDYLLDKKSRFQLTIHDEVSVEVWEGEEYVVENIRQILASFEWSLIPINADIEYTETNWAEKKGA